MGLTSFIKRAIPTAVGFATGGPVGAATALYGSDRAARAEKRARIQNEIAETEYQNYLRSLQMGLPGTSFLPAGLTQFS